MSRMIRPRPSAFHHYFVKPLYLQNIKPNLQPKIQYQVSNIIGKKSKVIKVQKRHYSAFSPKKPNNDPSFWILAIIGSMFVHSSFEKKK